MFALQKPVSAGRVAAKSQGRTRMSTVCQAQNQQRFTWLPGAQLPKHLDGSLPGDYGFDPLNLGVDPEALRWYQQAELVHSRTAMTAVAGILIPGLLTKIGILNVPQWYDAGKVSVDQNGIPFNALLAVQLILCHFVEVKRWQDFRKPGSQAEKGSFFGLESGLGGTGQNGYPGGLFDPLGYSKSGNLRDLQTKEIKNGRLAMLAFIGFSAQYSATGKGPIDNLFDHLSDPWNNTFITNGLSVPPVTRLV